MTRLLLAYRRVIVWKPEEVCSLAQVQSTSVSIFVHFDSKITAVYIYSGIQISTKAALIRFFVIQMMALQICWLCPHLKLAQILKTQECDQRVLYKGTEAHSPKHASYHVFSLSAGWNKPDMFKNVKQKLSFHEPRTWDNWSHMGLSASFQQKWKQDPFDVILRNVEPTVYKIKALLKPF